MGARRRLQTHDEPGREAQGHIEHEEPQEKVKEGVNLVGQEVGA